jgi:hypothetical protein
VIRGSIDFFATFLFAQKSTTKKGSEKNIQPFFAAAMLSFGTTVIKDFGNAIVGINAKDEKRNTKYEIRNTKYEIRNTKLEKNSSVREVFWRT